MHHYTTLTMNLVSRKMVIEDLNDRFLVKGTYGSRQIGEAVFAGVCGVFRLSLLFYLMPGSSLLSHGETPHYHRRYGVSLLSSAWGQVGPPRYGRQANSVLSTRHVLTCRFNLYQAENLLSSAKTPSAL